MKAFQTLRRKLGRKAGAIIGSFEGGLIVPRLKTSSASVPPSFGETLG